MAEVVPQSANNRCPGGVKHIWCRFQIPDGELIRIRYVLRDSFLPLYYHVPAPRSSVQSVEMVVEGLQMDIVGVSELLFNGHIQDSLSQFVGCCQGFPSRGI